jgi:hypothetical protein
MNTLIWGIILITSFASFASPPEFTEFSNLEIDNKIFIFDFSTGEKKDYGFKGLFRDIPKEVHDNYLKIVESGGNLGPVPPETILKLATEEETSHWFMNAGIYKVPDNDNIYGYLLQGVNRSDDMDKYMVKKFGPQDGLLPDTDYGLVVLETVSAANDCIGAYGPGGGEVRNFKVVVMNKDPYTLNVDDINHVRFTDNNRPPVNYPSADGLGGTGVCQIPGTFQLLPGVPICQLINGRIPYAIKKRSHPTRRLQVKTNNEGFFWLLIGGHSGHESLDEYFIIKLQIAMDGEFSK